LEAENGNKKYYIICGSGLKLLTSEGLNNNLFLIKDGNERNDWQMEAENNKMKLVHKPWEWAK